MSDIIYLRAGDTYKVGSTELVYDPDHTYVTSDKNVIQNARPVSSAPIESTRPAILKGAKSAGNNILSLGTNFKAEFNNVFPSNLFFIRNDSDNPSPFGCAFNQQNVSVADGQLGFVLNDTHFLGKNFSGAEIQSNDTYTYGTFIARIKPSNITGCMNGSFFLYAGVPGDETRHYEIDPAEFIIKNGELVMQTNYFRAGVGLHEHYVHFQDDITKDFHDVQLYWKSNELIISFDGKAVWGYVDDFSFPTMQIMANLWNGDNSSGAIAFLGQFDTGQKGEIANTKYESIEYKGQISAVDDKAVSGNSLKISPNPASDKFRIEYNVPETATNVSIKVYNFLGVEIADIPGQNGRNIVDFSPEEEGAYMFVVTNNGIPVATEKGYSRK